VDLCETGKVGSFQDAEFTYTANVQGTHLYQVFVSKLLTDFIYANELVIKDGKVSGEFIWPIGAGKEKKAQIIHHLCKDMKISPEEVIYVGDSETDLDAFKIVGTSIAFNSQSETLKKASSHVVEGNDLRGVLKFLK